MQHKLILFLLLAPVLFVSTFAWELVKLDENVSISFPSKPEKTIFEGKHVWIATVDSTAQCMAMITDLKKLGADVNTLTEQLKRKETYQILKSGMLRGSPGAVVLSESITTFKGKPAYRIKLDLKGEKEDYNIAHILTVYINAKMYTITFMETYQSSHEADKNKFWNSLKLE
ncbi:hypothetical protein GM921_07420 [Pedobacter sp. LMG 31464]|uniref:Uncharacterized protein n=1 Tax=Pedobacter planticolens TaxID=2679964 RepID=A0A923IUV6_9SPHI|nr:hypothetical protein [Pedobacter planticolens]MBB2145306.1 hypothetical protein [Pedobacter planticolens]